MMLIDIKSLQKNKYLITRHLIEGTETNTSNRVYYTIIIGSSEGY